MIRLALRSVRARWGRVVLTALAIVASTAFLSGTFIFRDTVQRTFNALFADVFERVDGYVQSSNSVEGFLGFERRDRLPVDVVDEVRAVDGVADAQAFVRGRRGRDRQATASRSSDRPRRRSAPRSTRDRCRCGGIAQGRSPTGPTEVALDTITAEDAGYVVGDTVKVNAEGGSRDVHARRDRGLRRHRLAGQRHVGAVRRADREEFVAKPGFVDAVLVKGDGIGQRRGARRADRGGARSRTSPRR